MNGDMTKMNSQDKRFRQGFHAFVQKAKVILSAPGSRPKSAPPTNRGEASIGEFESFVAQATPIVIREVRETLQARRATLEKLCRWVVPRSCDLLTAAGLSGNEDFYTNLIRWMLWPEGRPNVALRCQRAWLNALGLHDVAASIGEAVEPVVQFRTADGRPDMVMHFQRPAFLLIVEAKVGSKEHDTPESEWQTEGYPRAVRQKLGLPEDHPCKMVFLTPGGCEAASPSAVVTTYEALVMAIAESLSPDDLGQGIRFGYSNVITHFLTHVPSGGSDEADVLRQLSECLQSEPKDLSDGLIMKELGRLGPLCRTLSIGKSQ